MTRILTLLVVGLISCGGSRRGPNAGDSAASGDAIANSDGPSGDDARFRHELTVVIDGQGTVTSTPAGITCPNTCTSTFTADSSVNLTADPAPGWSFDAWSGACSDDATVRITEACTCVATFTTTLVESTWAHVFEVEGDGAGGPVLDGLVAASSGAFISGGAELHLLHLDGGGAVDWRLAYGGFDNDWAHGMVPTATGWLLAGSTWSTSRYKDIWLVAVSSIGERAWTTTLGGAGSDGAASVQSLMDGFILAGDTDSFGAGEDDAWVVYADPGGFPMWQKAYGGSDDDEAAAVLADTSGFLVVGTTASFGAGGDDLWILRLDSQGQIQWQKTYGGTGNETGRGVSPAGDGWLVVGETRSAGAGGRDAWLLRIDNQGDLLSQQTIGGSSHETVAHLAARPGGGWLMSGHTFSDSAGLNDAWIVMLTTTSEVAWQKTYGGSGNDGAKAAAFTADGGILVSAVTNSFGLERSAPWVMKTDAQGAIDSCPTGLINDPLFPLRPSSLVVGESAAMVTATTATRISPSTEVRERTEVSHPQCAE